MIAAEDFTNIRGPVMPGHSAAEALVLHYWDDVMFGPKRLPSGLAAGPVLPVKANHGRWIVSCPFCPSASFASRRDWRFWCVRCGNGTAGGAWLPITWPDAIRAIEAALRARPVPNRNWWPGITLDDLTVANREMGVA